MIGRQPFDDEIDVAPWPEAAPGEGADEPGALEAEVGPELRHYRGQRSDAALPLGAVMRPIRSGTPEQRLREIVR